MIAGRDGVAERTGIYAFLIGDTRASRVPGESGRLRVPDRRYAGVASSRRERASTRSRWEIRGRREFPERAGVYAFPIGGTRASRVPGESGRLRVPDDVDCSACTVGEANGTCRHFIVVSLQKRRIK